MKAFWLVLIAFIIAHTSEKCPQSKYFGYFLKLRTNEKHTNETARTKDLV